MARKIYSRLKITGKICAETPLHVGGIGGNSDTDMALAINGKGEFYIPGTSIAGVLRAWCNKNFGDEETNRIFGYRDKANSGTEDDKSHASFVLIEDAVVENSDDIEDAVVENSDDVVTEIRDGVGIDRFYGVAADKAKYDREILPKGTKLKFEMTVEIDEEENQLKTKTIFGYLLEAMENEEIRFGGSRTRGLGRIKLEIADDDIKEQKLQGFDSMLALLENKGETKTIDDLKSTNLEPNKNPHLEIIIDWLPIQPLMVKAGFKGIGVDMLPLTSGIDGENVSLCLPGSSIKGAMRSQAERIMRTLIDCPTTQGVDFHEQIKIYLVSEKQIKKIDFIDELFGAKAEKNGNGTLGLAALSIDDCYAEKTIEKDDWNAVTIGTTKKGNDEISYFEQDLWKSLRKIDGANIGVVEEVKKDTKNFKIQHHNAIDRFTGGTAKGALYSVLAPVQMSWNNMRFSLDFTRINEAKQKQCLFLLLLVLRDLSENRLPLGFATNRGMGEIKIKSIELKGKYLDKIGLDGDISIEIKDGRFIASDNLKSLGGQDWWKN